MSAEGVNLPNCCQLTIAIMAIIEQMTAQNHDIFFIIPHHLITSIFLYENEKKMRNG
jgi:hypothetical protein